MGVAGNVMSVPRFGTNLRYRPWPASLGVVPTAALMVKQVRLQGLVVGSRRQQQDMVCAINATHLRPVIDSSFSLELLAAAFCYQEAGKHFGKICAEC